MDIILSISGLVALSPVMIIIVLRIYLRDKGPVIYSQERIGLNGKPFVIYKFRSMIMNAETNRPLLSSDDDSRITPFGKFMRKWRLDELPQLWNILKGEMTFIGPRAERKFFINQIVAQFPEYHSLLETKPGLTSWGMVQFGYAHNVQEMVTRSKYDLDYCENISFLFDIMVIIDTIKILLSGKGK